MIPSAFKRLRPAVLLPVLLLAGLGGGWGGVAIVDRLESEPTFCNSCHLPSGTPLHRLKLKIAEEAPALDLTARHFQQSGRGKAGAAPFSCADCHRGKGWRERGRVLLNSAVNTFRYAVLSFQEPERLARPISNRACLACHAAVSGRRDPSRFHGIKAHLDQQNVRCSDCHRSHAASKRSGAHVAELMSHMSGTCRICHKGREPAPPVRALLETIRADLSRPFLSGKSGEITGRR